MCLISPETGILRQSLREEKVGSIGIIMSEHEQFRVSAEVVDEKGARVHGHARGARCPSVTCHFPVRLAAEPTAGIAMWAVNLRAG